MCDYYRCELSRRAFSRSVTLPADVDDTKAKAEMHDGMLEITLPKLEQAKKRDIKIHSEPSGGRTPHGVRLSRKMRVRSLP